MILKIIKKRIENLWKCRARIRSINRMTNDSGRAIWWACFIAKEEKWKKDITYKWMYKALCEKHAVYCKYFRDKKP